MPFQLSNPVVRNGIEYPLVGVSLAISPRWRDGDVGGAVVLSLSPYAIDGDGKVVRPTRTMDIENDGVVTSLEVVDNEATIRFSVPDVYVSQDAHVQQALAAIASGIQQFIQAKGW